MKRVFRLFLLIWASALGLYYERSFALREKFISNFQPFVVKNTGQELTHLHCHTLYTFLSVLMILAPLAVLKRKFNYAALAAGLAAAVVFGVVHGVSEKGFAGLAVACSLVMAFLT